MEVIAPTRVFLFNSLRLPDPDPEMGPDEVRMHYSSNFPALGLSSVSAPTLTPGNELEFTFERPTGQVKG